MAVNVKRLISEGESVTVDFKQTITSPKKIAKTISAFSNASGGFILVGVKDNGVILGTEPDEERYMLEAAAEQFCKPAIALRFEVFLDGGKKVLVAIVPELELKPCLALGEDGKWWAYIRSKDQVLLASKVLLEVMKNRSKEKGSLIRYTEIEQQLFSYLSNLNEIGFYDFCQLVKIKPYKAVSILADLVSAQVLLLVPGEKSDRFLWNPKQ